MSIGMSDELAAECLDILTYEDIVPDICADFALDSLELAVNSSYRFEEQRPETKSLNSQTLAAQISYDAKQSYLSEIENAALARKAENARGLTTYDPHQIGYVEFSTKHGFSASTKGIKVIADNEINVPVAPKEANNQNKWAIPIMTAVLVGAVVLVLANRGGSSGGGSSGSTCTRLTDEQQEVISRQVLRTTPHVGSEYWFRYGGITEYYRYQGNNLWCPS